MQEEWRDIPGYEGIYQASSCGRIKSLSYKGTGAPRVMSPNPNNRGYFLIRLRKKGAKKGSTYCVHRLIATVFIPNPDSLPCVNHKNGIKTDNRVGNLEWCTYRDNLIHSINVLHTDRNRKRKVQVKCQETGKTYSSYVEAAQDTGVPAQNIRAVANKLLKKDGKGNYYVSKSAGGRHWALVQRKIGQS